MKQFFSRPWFRRLASLLLKWRSLYLLLRGLQHGRWILGEYGNIQGTLFYSPFLPAKRSYRLYVPAGHDGVTKLPLVVMLHGCRQNAVAFAASTRMNQIADREQFLVLYPEQSEWANKYQCWNWFDPSTNNGNGEALLIANMVGQVTQIHAVDSERVYAVGLSAGGAMTSILASCYSDIFAACAIHSGLTFRAASSSVEAVRSMKHGAQMPAEETARLAWHVAPRKPRAIPILVIQGSADEVVRPINADQIVSHFQNLFAYLDSGFGEKIIITRQSEQKKSAGGGHHYFVADHLYRNQLLLRKVIVEGMGHAWSGGERPHPFNDPKGPDASRMIWEFFCSLPRYRKAVDDSSSIQAGLHITSP